MFPRMSHQALHGSQVPSLTIALTPPAHTGCAPAALQHHQPGRPRAPISTGRQVWVPLQSPREVFPPLPPTPSRAGPKGTVHHRPCQPVPCVYPRGPLNPQPAVEQGLPRASWLSEQMRKLLYFSRALREFLQGGCRNLSLEGQGCLWVSAHSLNLAMTPR